PVDTVNEHRLPFLLEGDRQLAGRKLARARAVEDQVVLRGGHVLFAAVGRIAVAAAAAEGEDEGEGGTGKDGDFVPAHGAKLVHKARPNTYIVARITVGEGPESTRVINHVPRGGGPCGHRSWCTEAPGPTANGHLDGGFAEPAFASVFFCRMSSAFWSSS